MEYEKSISNRMKRIEGQIRGILRMMEEQKDCEDVIVQLSAARSAIDRTIAIVVSKNLEQCVREKALTGENSDELVQQAVQLLVKSR